jgi:plasmid stability protein
MARITVRHLDRRLVRLLRQRARAAGHTVEQEVRLLLARALVPDADAFWERMAARRARYGGRLFSDSARLMRELREEASSGRAAS